MLPPSTPMPRRRRLPRRRHRAVAASLGAASLPCPQLLGPALSSSILLCGEPPTPCHFGWQMERNRASSSGEAPSSTEIGITIQISLDSPPQAPHPHSVDAILNECSLNFDL
jgi:hypothetical protein